MTPPSGLHCKKIDNRMIYSSNCQFFCNSELDASVIWFSFFCQCEPDGCVIGVIVELKFYIGVQEEGIRVQEELVIVSILSGLATTIPT